MLLHCPHALQNNKTKINFRSILWQCVVTCFWDRVEQLTLCSMMSARARDHTVFYDERADTWPHCSMMSEWARDHTVFYDERAGTCVSQGVSMSYKARFMSYYQKRHIRHLPQNTYRYAAGKSRFVCIRYMIHTNKNCSLNSSSG